MVQKEAVREFKRGLIIEAARRLFSHHSYKDVTVQDIAEASGIGKATLYHYFSSKEEIFFNLVYRVSSETNHVVMECASKHQDPGAALEELIGQTYLLYLQNNRIFLNYLGLKLQGEVKPECLEKIRGLRDIKYQMIADILARGSQQGLFIAMDSYRLARVLNNILRGFSIEPLESRDGEQIQELDRGLISSVLMTGITAYGGGSKGA